MNPAAFVAIQIVQREARSALPDAPVVAPFETRPNRRTNAARVATAGLLRRAADRLEAPEASANYG
jgi:hypothetical protein